MDYDTLQLEAVFGAGSIGSTPDERARTSRRLFVRSLSQLAPDQSTATGRRLTAWEALSAYGWDALREIESEGTALLSAGPSAPGQAIQTRREMLGLSVKQVARRSGLVPNQVTEAERNERSVRLRTYERIAQSLGMDERFISVLAEPVGDDRLAVRLRMLGGDAGVLSATEVAAIAEAAWIASTQLRLERALDLDLASRRATFEPSSNYGSRDYPVFMHGYWLADETRRKLGLGTGPLSKALREICEDLIGIPVIQAELGEWLAGVTVQASSDRAIVTNVSGANGRRVFVRRSTLAHELGHLLYDPDDRLSSLVADTYSDLDRPDQARDAVEQRANAFSVQFIAPREAVLELFHTNGGEAGDGLTAVMEKFGISFTAARYHIWNATEHKIPLDRLRPPRREPSEAWEALESYAIDWNPLSLPPSRAGRFSAVVVRAAEKRVISWDTAAEYLLSTPAAVQAAIPTFREMFPTVLTPSW